MKIMLCLSLSLLLLAACSSSNHQNDPCTYESFPGVAKFTELNPLTDAVQARFGFTPSDPVAPLTYLKDHENNLQIYSLVAGYANPTTSEWLVSRGIVTGVELPAAYEEIRSGGCQPFMITFPTITGAIGGYAQQQN